MTWQRLHDLFTEWHRRSEARSIILLVIDTDGRRHWHHVQQVAHVAPT